MTGPRCRRRLLPGVFAAGGLAVALAAQAQSAGTGAETQSPAGLGELFRGVSLTPGPLAWRGDLTTEFRSQWQPDQPARHAFQESGTLTLATYLYQPWFAQLSGNLGFLWINAQGDSSGRSVSLNGGGSVTVFPASRFPFEASLALSDARANENATGADYRTLALGLRQSYRALDNTQYTLRVDRSEISSAALGEDVLDVATATVTRRFDAHNASADAFVSRNAGGTSGTETRIRRLNATHGYVPLENLSVDSFASYDWQEVGQRLGPFSTSAARRFAQLTSYATWRPDEGEPLYDENHPLLLTGGLRITALGFELGAASAQAVGINASAGASYDFTPRLRASATGSLARASADAAGNDLFSSFSANLSYDPPPIAWGAQAYSWRVSGGSNGGTGGGLDRLAAFAQANHQLSRGFPLADRSLLTLSFAQGLATSYSTREGGGQGLSNSLQATWTLAGEATTQTYVGFSASDVRSSGTPDSEFQLVNLQLTRQAPVDALSYWTANLTVQGTRQQTRSNVAGTTFTQGGRDMSFSAYGSLSYQHRRVFGIPRLAFSATYTATGSQLQSRAQGDLEASPQVLGDTFDGRLEYRIGKLDTRLVLRSAAVDGRRNTGLYLRATRYF